MLSKLTSTATAAFLIGAVGFAAPARAQIFVEPTGGPFLVCAFSGALQVSDPDDNCEGNRDNVTSLTFGSGVNNVITFTDAGTATFSNSTVQMSGLQAYSGTSAFNSTVTFTGPSVTFSTGTTFQNPATFNGAADFNAAITTGGITNAGTIDSTTVNANTINALNSLTATDGTITNLLVNNIFQVGSGSSIDMGGNRINDVGAGVADTDAVNVAQLNAATAAVTADVTALETVTATHATQIADLQTGQATTNDNVAANTTAIATNTTAIAANTTAIAANTADIADLQSYVGTLFDLRGSDRRDMKQGIASAVAMANAPMPSPGHLGYAFNGAVFRGEYAVGGSLAYRLPGPRSFAVTAGFSYAGNKNNAARIGVAGEF
jgi:hypothetical protein